MGWLWGDVGLGLEAVAEGEEQGGWYTMPSPMGLEALGSGWKGILS